MLRKVWLILYNFSIMIPVLLIAAYVYRLDWLVSILFILVSVITTLFSSIFPYIASNSSSDSIKIVSIAPNDTFHESILSYALPLLSFVFGLGPQYFVLLVLLVCVFMYISDSHIPNPILRLMGYHFYSIDLEDGIHGYLLISKHGIYDSKQISSGKLISNYIIIDSNVKT